MTQSVFRERREVPRLTDPSVEEVRERFFDPGLPCVFERVHSTDDLAEWMQGIETSPTIVPCVVARSLNISRISDSDRPPVARAADLPEVGEFSVDLPLAEAWGRISHPGRFAPLLTPGECVYVIEGRVPPERPFPKEIPATPLSTLFYADRRTPLAIVNMPGMINRNHAHVHEVLLHQVHNRKKVRLFSPADSMRLYMNSERRSEVPDFDRVDLARFPRVAETTAHETVLEPGDVLFLPSYWWHEIRVDEPAVSVGFTIEAGSWAKRAFALHHALADALAGVASGEAAEHGAGVASIVVAVTAALLDESGLDATVAALRYEYTD